MLPLISVVITLFNSRSTLPYCLGSVVKQTHPDIEIILVDDGSDEDYSDIIKSFNDSRISYYKLRHFNANVVRNYGIMKSRGEYIAMLDSDDLWLPNHLEDCLGMIQKNTADGLYGSLIIKNVKNDNGQEFKVRPLNEGETMVDYLLRTGYGAQTSTLFLSADSVKNIKWDESLKRHQDYDFVIRYDKSYKLAPKINPTVVHIHSPKIGKIDFSSCIRVIEKNKKDIEPFLYNRYHQNMLDIAKSMSAGESIIKHYKKESVRFLEYIPYSQYILISDPKTRLQQIKCKMKYLLYILQVFIG